MLEKGVPVSRRHRCHARGLLQPLGVAGLAGHRQDGRRACSSTRSATCLDRETALRMWTENVTWFSNEEGQQGRIEAGQLADLIVPDSDYFAVPEDEICVPELRPDRRRRARGLRRGRLRAAGRQPAAACHARLVADAHVQGLCRLGRPRGHRPQLAASGALSQPGACGCGSSCGLHGHRHATAWASAVPASDLRGFFGALGCSCWMA